MKISEMVKRLKILMERKRKVSIWLGVVILIIGFFITYISMTLSLIVFVVGAALITWGLDLF